MLLISFRVQIEVVNEANRFEHWTVGFKRHKRQKKLVAYYMNQLSLYRDMPLTIKLIRISPRKLDEGDNLPMAFKWVKDAIAEILNPGKEDVNPETICKTIEYNQNLRPGQKRKRLKFVNTGRADDSSLFKWEYDQEKGKVKEKSIRVEIYERSNSSANDSNIRELIS